MHKIHPQTQLFFEKFKDIISHAIHEKEVTIERYVIETHSNNYGNYKFNSQYEFNDAYNYYVEKEWQKNQSLVRYHVREYQKNEQVDLSQIIIDDLTHAFVESDAHFQWVVEYGIDFTWTDVLFTLEMPDKDRQKLFDILGPSTRVHELIHEQFKQPHFFKMIMNTYEKYGGNVTELYYKDVLEDVLNNDYASADHELLEVAKRYITLYINTFNIQKYEQQRIFNTLTKLVPKEQLIFFKDNFKNITFIEPNSIEKNSRDLQPTKSILSEKIVNIKKLWIDKDAIAAHFPKFITEDEIASAIFWFTQSIHQEEKQLLNIDDIQLRGQYLYIESPHSIDTEKITYCLYSLLHTTSALSFEEFNAIGEQLIEDRKNKKEFVVLKPYIMKAVLDYELPVTKNRSSLKKI